MAERHGLRLGSTGADTHLGTEGESTNATLLHGKDIRTGFGSSMSSPSGEPADIVEGWLC